MTRDHDRRFFEGLLVSCELIVTDMLILDLRGWGWHQRLVLDGNWILSAKYKSPRLFILESRRIHCWVGHSNLDSFPHSFIHSNIMTESLPLSVHRVYTPPWKNISLLDEALPVHLIFILFAWISTCHLKNLDELSDCKSSALPLRPPMMTVMAIVVIMTMLFWSCLRSNWVMTVLVVLWWGVKLDVSEDIRFRGQHASQLSLVDCILIDRIEEQLEVVDVAREELILIKSLISLGYLHGETFN